MKTATFLGAVALKLYRNIEAARGSGGGGSTGPEEIHRIPVRSSSSWSFQAIHFAVQSEDASRPISHHASSAAIDTFPCESHTRTVQ